MIILENDSNVDEILEHYGIKGMRWGVRKKEELSTEDQVARKAKIKKAVIIGGSVLAAASITAGAIYLKKRYDVSISTKSAESISKGKAIVEKIIQEPTSTIHSSRGKNRGYTFLKNGGIKDPESQFLKVREQLKLGDDFRDNLVRFGERNEKIYANFTDPLKRKDRSGRDIVHDIILPELRAQSIQTLEQVKDLVWDEIKDDFEQYYNSPS